MPRTVLALAPMASFDAPLWRDRAPLAAETTCLSEREISVWSRLRRPERRRQWLAARLLAKWAFLRETAGPASAAALDFELRVVGGGHLGRFSPEAYRAIDVLPAEGGAGRPRLSHHARATGFDLSLAHTRSWVACAVGSDHPVGVDVEGIEPRAPAFRDYAFGVAERRWIDGRVLTASAAEPALQTWLWSMKEAAFKTGLCPRGCPAIEVAVNDGWRAPTVTPTRARAAFPARDAVIDGKRAQWIAFELAGSVTSVVRFASEPVPRDGSVR